MLRCIWFWDFFIGLELEFLMFCSKDSFYWCLLLDSIFAGLWLTECRSRTSALAQKMGSNQWTEDTLWLRSRHGFKSCSFLGCCLHDLNRGSYLWWKMRQQRWKLQGEELRSLVCCSVSMVAYHLSNAPRYFENYSWKILDEEC